MDDEKKAYTPDATLPPSAGAPADEWEPETNGGVWHRPRQLTTLSRKFDPAKASPIRTAGAHWCGAGQAKQTWESDGGYKCLNCDHGLSQHEGQVYCPAAPADGQEPK